MFSLQFLGLLLILSGCLQAEALECYSCINSSPQDCSQPNIHALRVTSCPSGFTRCTKFIGNDTDGIFVERSCGPPEVCDTVKLFLDNILECHTCESDLCNSSSIPAVSMLVLIPIFTSFLLRSFIK
ncbi:uncharacterized protein LOC129790508 [Lutzomyia longipalpis]|uniref:uncharacterized protein LOC129790508 n=1 Tax=Lutzomyia longipalpis TaxID=7200 RepID=UPI002484612E|nr:uncharacterized protein LOC129790508 [Lutzomyia longipalpis]